MREREKTTKEKTADIADRVNALERAIKEWDAPGMLTSTQQHIDDVSVLMAALAERDREIARLKEENARLTESRDHWKREWSLMNAAELKAEAEIAKLRRGIDSLKARIAEQDEYIEERSL